jgi:cytochrome c oxidase cbb3-type subunit 3
MSSPCRRPVEGALLAVCLLLVASCEREEREPRGTPVGESGPGAITLSGLYPGDPAPPDPRRHEYESNAYHISQGQQLYRWFNCNGCHANGGGDIGPPLVDDTWLYGSELENIVATIVQGRPNGMPSFRNRIPEQQVWQIAAYVRSMSGQTPKAASPGRSDHIHAKASEQSTPRAEPKNSSATAPNLDGRQ